jgi:hypothetical protein
MYEILYFCLKIYDAVQIAITEQVQENWLDYTDNRYNSWNYFDVYKF